MKWAGILQMQLFQINQSEESSKITINAHTTSCPLHEQPITWAAHYMSCPLPMEYSIFYVICQKCIYRSINFRIIECLSNNEVISAVNQGRFWSYGRWDMLHNHQATTSSGVEPGPFYHSQLFFNYVQRIEQKHRWGMIQSWALATGENLRPWLRFIWILLPPFL